MMGSAEGNAVVVVVVVAIVVVVGHRGNAGGLQLRGPPGSGRSDESPAPKRLKSAAHTPTDRENNIGVSPKAASLLAREMDFPCTVGNQANNLVLCNGYAARAALPHSTFLSSFQPVPDRSALAGKTVITST
ncbi:hypothetical protein K0M31_002496 [Melipona bicolor]|uniref:Secreted protein n=1 Tax=Melipona bicolor TaxID=60889 RepID=A0AA40KYP5_9HYME|nr:hypothetical protein K0M31_002496 [Melipona bicolor]